MGILNYLSRLMGNGGRNYGGDDNYSKSETEHEVAECATEPKPERATEQVAVSSGKGESASGDKRKMRIYNLIIVDESGSMTSLRDVTLSGINETIGTIRAAQEEHADVQEHFLTLVTFDSRGGRRYVKGEVEEYPAVRTIYDAVPVMSVKPDFNNYYPNGCTPLYDAMGDSLTALREKIGNDEDATGVITVLTDGLENASREWRADSLRQLIEQLKEMGWVFSYMGSAHNVKEVTDLLSIDNVIEFSHDDRGAGNTWRRDRASKGAYYEAMARECFYSASCEERRERKKQLAKGYYSKRVSEDYDINRLEPNQVVVMEGEPAGLHGQVYNIPIDAQLSDIEDFFAFARHNPELTFIVQRLDFRYMFPGMRAHLAERVVELENVTLPMRDWEMLGLKM